MEILVEKVLVNPEQPRKVFDQVTLEELAESIRIHGVINPVAVEEAEDGFFILHDGERRVRAAKMAGMERIPAQVVPALDGQGPKERLERALVANIQREDMNVLEEAVAFQRMRERYGLTTREVADRIGKTGPAGYHYVYSRSLIMKLEEPIQKLIAQGKLSYNHQATRALLLIEDPVTRVKMAKNFAVRKSTIKTIERICKKVALKARAVGYDDAFAAMRYARGKGASGPAHQKWNSLMQLGKAPPWETVVKSAEKTCRRCLLGDIASEAVCVECGVVEMLRIMMRVK